MAKAKAGRNTRRIKFPHLVGSKWTAVHAVMGWRHFQVRCRQDRTPPNPDSKGSPKDKRSIVWAQMQSVCDESVQLWVNANTLKNPDLWQAGWLSLSEEAGAGSQGLGPEGWNADQEDGHGGR